MTDKNTTKSIGDLGETVAAQYLINHDFCILNRNYRKKWGEIDIIAEKAGIVHFVEVKSVSYETKEHLVTAVKTETWRPEEQVHRFKIGQITKTLESWIAEEQYNGDWVMDVIAVRLVPRETFASVNFLENVILD